MKTHLDLFSGIGGFALAANAAGFETICFCEKDDFCQKILKKHWPNITINDDIKTFNASKYLGVDLLTGGFPCQPYSLAGTQQEDDDRKLWPEMLRVIQECQPTWIIGENVPGIINLALDGIITDLEKEDYEVQSFVIPACAVNAPHKRDRVWIVAHTKRERLQGQHGHELCGGGGGSDNGSAWIKYQGSWSGFLANSFSKRTQVQAARKQPAIQMSRSQSKDMDEGCIQDPVGVLRRIEPRICGVAYGVPNRVDRIKCLGNAIVPQVAFELLRNIAIINKNETMITKFEQEANQ